MQNVEKFEIHYFFQDSSHSMDAIIRNKCEAEFLAIAYEIIQQLDLPITLDAEALKEGGLRDIWKFVGNASYSDLVATAALLVAVLQFVFSLPSQDQAELITLQKEEVKLSIEEKKLAIEKLKSEQQKGIVTQQAIKATAKVINHDSKIAVRKSNFYRILQHYEKVNKVGFSGLDEKNKPTLGEVIIDKSQFSHFILNSNKLPVEIIEDAQIEIVAPVLREGNAKWKGIYIMQPPISFEMKDKIFKDQVLGKQISFKSGDIIVCVLEIHRELNEIGEVQIVKYCVQTVLEKIENGRVKETQSGAKYRREKELMDKQTSLDLN